MAQLCNFIAISVVKQEEFRQAEQFLRKSLALQSSFTVFNAGELQQLELLVQENSEQ